MHKPLFIPRIMEIQNKKLLVIDDEQDLCEILKFNLETEGYEVDTANSAEEAFQKGLNQYDLLLLDVMMEGMSGFALAHKMKEDASLAAIPIIFLTARDTENDMVTGFKLGADDYISKPFSIREVLLRVQAVLRRTAAPAPKETENIEDTKEELRHEGLVMNLENKTVAVDGTEVAFTRTEFELLRILLHDKPRVFSRQELIAKVWPKDVLVLDRTVDVNITRIRKKIGPYARLLITRHGFGYYFDA